MNVMKITTSNFNHQLVIRSLVAVLVSSLVACASVDKKDGFESVEPGVQSVSADQTEEQQESPQEAVQETSSQEASSANADALMATLAAPIVEPGSKDAAPVAKKKAVVKIAKKTEEAKPVVVPAKTVEVKKAVAKVVKPPKPAPKKKPKKRSGAAKPLKVGLKDLPVNYDIWVLKNGETPLTKGLVISTPTWEMGKEGYVSQIWLTLMEDKILVNSSSDIATAAGDLGVRIDSGALIPFTRIAEHKIGVIEGEWFDKLAAADKLQVHLGFFPGKKPKSKVFVSETSLSNLDRLVLTHRKLVK